MKKKKKAMVAHPKGELEIGAAKRVARVLDSYGGVVRVAWDPEAEVTRYGQLVFFVEFLKTAGIFDAWVKGCPLYYTSHNAPEVRDVLGTTMLSILAGHRRYAHITSIRSDRVTPELLGMSKVMSEDSVRRALGALDLKEAATWLDENLKRCYEPLLDEPWILDIDSTVKPLYGHQEGAKLGYNSQKPGRPSHVYHTYFAANMRLILDTEVQPGNQVATLHAQPMLWSLLDRLPRSRWPEFLRGDCAWGNERAMCEAERREVPYLFKLKQTPNGKRLINGAFRRTDWSDAGQGWEGVEDVLRLEGWSKTRRVFVLRRLLKEPVVMSSNGAGQQQQLAFLEIEGPAAAYEYAVLVTTLTEPLLAVAQYYRDRADIENVFDEVKNQWSWGGFTTQDLARCKIIARVAALVFNWWSLFAGLAFPDRHAEAITSRPLLLHAVGRQVRHAGQKVLTLTSTHGQHAGVRKALWDISRFLGRLRQAAEQLTQTEVWQLMLSRIFVRFLRGRILGKVPRLYRRLALA
jgi:hypothetical protein